MWISVTSLLMPMLADLEEFRKNPNINFDYGDVDLLDSGDEPTQHAI